MIESLYSIGKAMQNAPDDYGHYFAPWENPFPVMREDTTYKVLVFDINEDKVSGPEFSDFRSSWLGRYLYRKPKGARGAPLVPTGFFYPNSNEEKHLDGVEKLMNRLERSITGGRSLYFSSDATKVEGLVFVEAALQRPDYSTKGVNYLITFRINGKWLGEYEELKLLFEDEAYEKYYEKSKAKGKTCSLSYEPNVEVWGRVDTLGFTVNDVAFNRGGFNDKQSYKMFPVSKPAVIALEGARRFALAQLTESFFSLRYMVVPRMIEGSEQALLKVINSLAKGDSKNSLEQKLHPIMSSGERLSRIATREELTANGMLYDILFFQQNQAQFALVLHLQDVNPSHLSKVYHLIGSVSDFYDSIAAIQTKKERIPFQISFSRIKDYFSELVGTDYVFEPFFYQILEAVFYGNPLEEKRVIRAFMNRIRLDYKQRHESAGRYQLHTKQAFAIWQFFNQLDLFPAKLTIPMDDKQHLQFKYDAFIAQHTSFFSEPMLKAAFCMGMLTNILIFSQEQYLRNSPFQQRLNNLNLDKRKLKALLPKLNNKMAEYRKMDKLVGNPSQVSELETAVCKILLSDADANKDEISFAFVSGMVMQREFALRAAKEKKEATLEA